MGSFQAERVECDWGKTPWKSWLQIERIKPGRTARQGRCISPVQTYNRTRKIIFCWFVYSTQFTIVLTQICVLPLKAYMFSEHRTRHQWSRWPGWSSLSECFSSSFLRAPHTEQLPCCWLRWSSLKTILARIWSFSSFFSRSLNTPGSPRKHETV